VTDVRADRLIRILTHLTADADAQVAVDDVCAVARDLIRVRGAGILVATGNDLSQATATSDPATTLLLELHETLGEGPALDSHESGTPILANDLRAGMRDWPAFVPAAMDLGAMAMYCAPVRIGSVRLGSLMLWDATSGRLDDDQHADLLVLADVAARVVLDAQSYSVPVEAGWGFSGLGFESSVHQAAGMVSVQMGVSIGTALVHLRAHAFAEGTSLAAIANAVVARRLRFSSGDDGAVTVPHR